MEIYIGLVQPVELIFFGKKNKLFWWPGMECIIESPRYNRTGHEMIGGLIRQGWIVYLVPIFFFNNLATHCISLSLFFFLLIFFCLLRFHLTHFNNRLLGCYNQYEHPRSNQLVDDTLVANNCDYPQVQHNAHRLIIIIAHQISLLLALPVSTLHGEEDMTLPANTAW